MIGFDRRSRSLNTDIKMMISMKHARAIAALACLPLLGIAPPTWAQSPDCAFWESRRYTAWSRATVETVRACLETGISANKMTPRGHPVVLAANRSNLEVLGALLEGGGDPNASDDGKTALMAAISDINVDAHLRMSLLLEAGATLSPTDATEQLRRAAIWSTPETIDLLVARGGDPFARFATNGLLHFAAGNNTSAEVTARSILAWTETCEFWPDL